MPGRTRRWLQGLVRPLGLRFSRRWPWLRHIDPFELRVGDGFPPELPAKRLERRLRTNARRIVLVVAVVLLLGAAFAALRLAGAGLDATLVAIAALVQACTAVLIVLLTRRVASLTTEANRQAELRAEFEGVTVLEVDAGAPVRLEGGGHTVRLTIKNIGIRPVVMIVVQTQLGQWTGAPWTEEARLETSHRGSYGWSDTTSMLAPGATCETDVWLEAGWKAPFACVIRIEHGGMFGGEVVQSYQYMHRESVEWKLMDIVIVPSVANSPWIRRTLWSIPEYRAETPRARRHRPPT